MNSVEFEEIMYDIQQDNNMDLEQTHIAMDNLMSELLKSLGYEAGIKIFDKTIKFYS